MTDTTVITRRIEIDMGHRVPNHQGKCRNLHGHRYVFEVAIEGALTEESGDAAEGMVLDFGDIKTMLMEAIHDPYDHGLMLYERDPIAAVLTNAPECSEQKIVLVPFIPTAENIARHAYNCVADRLGDRDDLSCAYVKVWETPNATATYSRPQS